MKGLKIFAGTILSLAVATGANVPAFGQVPNETLVQPGVEPGEGAGEQVTPDPGVIDEPGSDPIEQQDPGVFEQEPEVQPTGLVSAEVIQIQRSFVDPNDLLITVRAADRYQTFVTQALTPALTLGQPVYVRSGLVFLDQVGRTPPVAYDPGVTGVAARYGEPNGTPGQPAVEPGQGIYQQGQYQQEENINETPVQPGVGSGEGAYEQTTPDPGVINEPGSDVIDQQDPEAFEEQEEGIFGQQQEPLEEEPFEEEPLEPQQEPLEEEPLEPQQEPFEEEPLEEEPLEPQQEPLEEEPLEEEPIEGLW